MTILNAKGHVVKVFSGTSEPGFFDIKWDATGNSSGVYFYRMEEWDLIASKKAMLMK